MLVPLTTATEPVVQQALTSPVHQVRETIKRCPMRAQSQAISVHRVAANSRGFDVPETVPSSKHGKRASLRCGSIQVWKTRVSPHRRAAKGWPRESRRWQKKFLWSMQCIQKAGKSIVSILLLLLYSWMVKLLPRHGSKDPTSRKGRELWKVTTILPVLILKSSQIPQAQTGQNLRVLNEGQVCDGLWSGVPETYVKFQIYLEIRCCTRTCSVLFASGVLGPVQYVHMV